ncbi:molybdenum ABC transporter ATP-binding protein ModC [Volucribacter amazonae]|uniref:Molybdenum ABC transporter ATP-binding protein n=1 Tax=Volucribacter amazonae TaxID=256731 RepID=A0A9X4SLI0_9PAST|nr:molybdenum ABC transporter ATP-binding protein ModC [Volucribacter amazonae]MDG6896189.1 molybdenum ABC transporter ATP-binding protein [Volucribacter amazonae]
MLQINVKKQLGQMLLDVNLTIPAQGVTAIFGLSGSGKSSLINLISGLLQPDQGKIQLNQQVLVDDKQSLAVHKRNIGYVFQDARLFPHYKVKGNLLYGVKRPDKQKFNHIIHLLGLEPLLTRYPTTLSGGEKQRVAIGRALLSNPTILLMDEPLSALDLPRKQELMGYLEQLAKEIHIPILYVTHSLDELIRLADQVILMQAGKVLAYQPIEQLWHNPLFIPWKQQQIEQRSILCLPISYHHPVYQMTALALDGLNGQQRLWVKAINQSVGDIVRVCVNSSDVSISLCLPQQTSIRNILQGQISKIKLKTDQVDLELKISQHKIWASISKWSLQELNLQPQQWVYVLIKAVSVVQ